MSILLLASRVVLALVFAAAAIAKLRDRSGTRVAFVGFGIPSALISPLALLVPIIELAVVGLLLWNSTAWYGAIASGGLLTVFTVVIAVTLANGRRPECHCFGDTSSRPIGWQTIARNLALGVAAAFAVLASPNRVRNLPEWFADFGTTHLAALVLVGCLSLLAVFEGVIIIRLSRRQKQILSRLAEIQGASTQTTGALLSTPGLMIGTGAPPFKLQSVGGATISLDTLRRIGRPLLLVFTDPSCGPCTALLPDVSSWQRDYRSKITLALISRGSRDENHSKYGGRGIEKVLLQSDREVAAAYQVLGTPSAVIVTADGKIGSRLAQGPAAIRELVGSIDESPNVRALDRTTLGGVVRRWVPANLHVLGRSIITRVARVDTLTRGFAHAPNGMTRREGLKSIALALGAFLFGIGCDDSDPIGVRRLTPGADARPLASRLSGGRNCKDAEHECVMKVVETLKTQQEFCKIDEEFCDDPESTCHINFGICNALAAARAHNAEALCRENPCGNCQVCLNGQCRERLCGPCGFCDQETDECKTAPCEPCMECDRVANTCVPVKCAACQECQPSDNTCVATKCAACEACDPNGSGACASTCPPCFECDRLSGSCVPTRCSGPCQICQNGQCVAECSGTQQCCDGTQCVDTSTDPLNCGGCHVACAIDETCRSGVCVKRCPPGQQLCPDGTCCDGTCNSTTGVCCPAGSEPCGNGCCGCCGFGVCQTRADGTVWCCHAEESGSLFCAPR